MESIQMGTLLRQYPREWCLATLKITKSLISVSYQFLAYSIAIMVVTLLVWFDIFENSDVLRVGNRTELISTYSREQRSFQSRACRLTHGPVCISLDLCRCTLLVDGHDGILRDPLEQPSFLGFLYLVPLVLFGAHRCTRIHYVQEEDVQLGRENQRSMESRSWSGRSCEDSEPGMT